MNDNATKTQIDLRQMILALETTVDLVGMNDNNHGKRVGYIASQLGHQLGFNENSIQFAFELGLLHDCGVSSEQMHTNLVNHFDWEEAHIHCQIGYRLLKDFEPLAHFATPILYHHTPWQELTQNKDISSEDALMANLIFLSDRIDISAAAHYSTDILLARKNIVRMIESYSGNYFNPDIVEAFKEAEQSEAFWIALEDRHVTRFTWDMGLFESKRNLTTAQLKQLSLILAYVVDQKSSFTAQHSMLVGELAHYLATLSGLNQELCEKIEIAGLLHDIGKLRIPDAILEKAGPLSAMERSIMDQHSYETYEILRHINGLEDIARWAAYHHEGLNGAGYPFHPTQNDISIEARIIAVADVFQALVQDRPYRVGMPIEQILSILDDLVTKGQLDPAIVALVHEYPQECFNTAHGKPSTTISAASELVV